MARELQAPARGLKYKLFKEGTTFSDLADAFRRDVALQRLLPTPGMTVELMASELGYHDPRHVYRRFKQWTGRTPREYRNGETKLAS